MADKIKDFMTLVVLYTLILIGVGAFVVADDNKSNTNTVEYQQF